MQALQRAILVMIAATMACTAAVGAGGAFPTGRPGAGATFVDLSTRVNPFMESSGPVVGLDHRVVTLYLPQSGRVTNWVSTRTSAFAGWGQLPLRGGGCVGFNVGATIGYERLPLKNAFPLTLAGGVQAELPIRLSPGASRWDADGVVDLTWNIVPRISAVYLPGARRVELAAVLAIQLQTFSSLLP